MVTNCVSVRAATNSVASIVASAASAVTSAATAAVYAAWGFAKTAAYFCIGCVGDLKDI